MFSLCSFAGFSKISGYGPVSLEKKQKQNLLINNGCAEKRPHRIPQMHWANNVSIVPIFSFVYEPSKPPNEMAGTKLAKNINTMLKSDWEIWIKLFNEWIYT